MFKDLKVRLAKRECQHDITQLIELMEGHKGQNLPPGHKFYVLLNARATDAITKLIGTCRKNGEAITISDVEVGIPKLAELQQLASGSSTTSASHVGMLVLAGIVGVAATVYLAAMHNVYVYLTHLSWLVR